MIRRALSFGPQPHAATNGPRILVKNSQLRQRQTLPPAPCPRKHKLKFFGGTSISRSRSIK